ncbi:MAG: hypothetical protein HY722_07095 [Planctomycetes bacterium]|nr:hypothetical protein [Planctomycetota bacterium]
MSDVEFHSAVARLHREGVVGRRQADRMRAVFDDLWSSIRRVPPLDAVALRARRLVGLHPLTAADALQLAAACVAARDDPRRLPFVCLDEQLAEAARREGFQVLP